ncbi:MAG: hypothetical protein CVV64_14525 [Candidatus Wallbacteria bacterium HGW-Wallbacteria-1]|uniref:Tetratricopeptide repeat protein n=1 Tax=Candidatus Wallbacteria bacterium HGW-Wallbacteria-1 TaxID=2013854 RepID=A0A2N1PM41_9BACT|nr:MAG: hypothetical protein CVV64_14525 [Candidatus Wallbacteria bacterium HGW-Wallbacteria-1]
MNMKLFFIRNILTASLHLIIGGIVLSASILIPAFSATGATPAVAVSQAANSVNYQMSGSGDPTSPTEVVTEKTTVPEPNPLTRMENFAFSVPQDWSLRSSGSSVILTKTEKDVPSITISWKSQAEVRHDVSKSNTVQPDLREYYRDRSGILNSRFSASRPGYRRIYQGIDWLAGDLCLLFTSSWHLPGKNAVQLHSLVFERSSAKGLLFMEVILGSLDDSALLADIEYLRQSLVLLDGTFMSDGAMSDFQDGLAAMASEMYPRAEASFSKAADLAEPATAGRAEALYRKALAIQAASGFKRVGESSALFGEASKEYGDHFPAMNQLAVCWAVVAEPASVDGQECIDCALRVFDDSLNVNPGCEETLRLKADLLMKLGKSKEVSPLLSAIMGTPALTPDALVFRKAVIKLLSGSKIK